MTGTPIKRPITCNLHSVDEINGPATIDQLLTDAATAGHTVTARMIRDWTQAGLLDYPQRRPAGKGHGSHPALYPEQQRLLLLTLLHHRAQNVGIRTLAQIPVFIWLYWGDAYVPLRQVRIALATWLGDPRTNRRRADEIARLTLLQFDHPSATPAARKRLRAVVAEAAYTGRVDLQDLEDALREVFEPGFGPFHRAVGPADAPLTVESQIELTRARLAAVEKVASGAFTDDDFRTARTVHLLTYSQYARQQPLLATQAPAGQDDLYAPVTAERAANEACGNLLTALGLGALHPHRAAQFARPTGPQPNTP